jgi:serine/threonine-protein kinase
VVSGKRPFYDSDWRNIQRRLDADKIIAPSRCESSRAVSSAFDTLILSCLARGRDDRPQSACVLADAIDAFLDAERARAECEREAEQHAREGKDATAELERLDADARRLSSDAEAILATIRPWEPIERKQEAWNLIEQARQSAAGAARALARAEAAFTRALGRIPNHRGARAGLTALYFRQFEAAEAQGDQEKMTQYLELARAYDDGALALELADQGVLSVQSVPRGAHLTIQRYEPKGPLLVTTRNRALGTMPPDAILLDSGSYVSIARYGDREVRYPFVVKRAKALSIKIRIPRPGEIPPGMILIPGGPFLRIPPRATQLSPDTLPDFAIGRFPVTLREYSRFLDSIEDPAERERRTPTTPDGMRQPLLIKNDGIWRIPPWHIEGKAKDRVPPERELDLPLSAITWFDALAYTRWMSKETGLAFRLPTDAEWDKAMRGADGRAYPMGNQLDAAFAKLRESRPEPSQPEPIGAFPRDESPYGVRDLAGGIGDWTATSADGAALPDASEEDLPSTFGRQALWRGGHWSSTWAARGWMRYSQEITARAFWVGLRLALSLDPKASSEITVSPMKAPG